jgi:hypothetical protein
VWCDINQNKKEKNGDNDGNNNNTGDVHQSHINGELVLFSMRDSYVLLALATMMLLWVGEQCLQRNIWVMNLQNYEIAAIWDFRILHL